MIVVTGGCGFIGSEIVRRLCAKGEKVRVVDNMSKPSSRVPDGVDFVQGNLAEPGVALEAFRGARACVNLAARIGGIGYFHKLPAEILSENNLIYSYTFEAAVAHKLERMLFMSSSMVFESADRFPSREEDLRVIPPPFTAYGFSKLIGEWYCRAFHDQYGLAYTIIRPFNAIGPEEAAGEVVGDAHVIPDLVKKIRGGQHPVEILGDGRQTRCFTHVGDIAGGVVLALDHPAAVNEDFNLGNSEEITMLELARRIYALCRSDKPFEARFVPGFPSDVRRRVPEASKARRVLGWEPIHRFEEALREVVGVGRAAA